MRYLKTIVGVASLLIAMAWVSDVHAQFAGGNVGLLLSDKARSQLGLDEEQTKRVLSLTDEFKDRMKASLPEIRKRPAEDRPEAFLKAVRERNQESKKSLREILTAEQMKRYEQYELWASGVAALLDPKVQDALELTEEQKARIRETGLDWAKNHVKLMNKLSSENKRRADLNAIEDAEMDKATAIMTDEQKARWNRMRGKRPDEY